MSRCRQRPDCGLSIAAPATLWRAAGILMFLLLPCHASANAVDAGLAYEGISSSNFDGSDIGYGAQAGYEFVHTEGWNYGWQLTYFDDARKTSNVDTAGDMWFRSLAAYATARPKGWPLTFRVGVVQADYKTLVLKRSATGWAAGLSLTRGDRDLRIHLIDVEHYQLGADHFNTFGVSVLFFL